MQVNLFNQQIEFKFEFSPIWPKPIIFSPHNIATQAQDSLLHIKDGCLYSCFSLDREFHLIHLLITSNLHKAQHITCAQ